MPDGETPSGAEELQFDRVITASNTSAVPSKLAVTCAACHTSIETEYYHINGKIFCGRCRTAVESATNTPRGIIPLVTAGIFGLGAGVIGAVIYYAVIAIAHLEIGIVAILIGYMVGYGVRKGARGRGGLRFQVLAAALTYASVALADAPIAIDAANRNAPKAPAPPASTAGHSHAAAAVAHSRAPTTKPGAGQLLLSFAHLLALIAALPVLVVIESFPYGLISAFIIFIGMRQAWRMTGAPWLEILGPYRVGAAPVPTPV